MPNEFDDRTLSQLRRALVRQASQRLGDEHEAEDVAQDALVALCTTPTSFSDLDHVAAFARRTVHNLCVDRIRRRVRLVDLDAADASYDTLEQQVITREEIAAVLAALAEINPAYAQVLVASTDVGRNHAAIAALTGVSLRNVRHGLDRGTKALKARLAASGHAVPGLIPAPLARLVARIAAHTRGRRGVRALAIAGITLPTLFLLLPGLIPPMGHGVAAHSVSGAPVQPNAVLRLPGTGADHSRLVAVSLTDPFNDNAFSHDAGELLHSSNRLKPDQCVLIDGHGICQTAPNPTYSYYTVKVPPQTGLPDIQVYSSDLPPCRRTVPKNGEVTCERGHPPAPFPVPTPAG